MKKLFLLAILMLSINIQASNQIKDKVKHKKTNKHLSAKATKTKAKKCWAYN